MVVYELKNYYFRKFYLLFVLILLSVGHVFVVIKGFSMINPITIPLIFGILFYILIDRLIPKYVITYNNETFEIKVSKTLFSAEKIYMFKKTDIKSTVTYYHKGIGWTIIKYNDKKIQFPRDENKDFDKFIDDLLNPTIKTIFQVEFDNNHS